MSFRHWTSVTLAASFTVYVAGCGYGDRQSGGTSPAEGRSNGSCPILNWKLGQAQSGGSDISREWIQKPRQARVTATG
jgi:hypothetical protein